MGQLGFFDADKRLAALSAKGDPLEAIDRLMPWESFRADIEAVVRTSEEMKKSSAGRKPADAIVMFRMLVLQALHNLSDEQAEYQVRDRFSFTRFLRLGIEDGIPDATTLWLFREKLAKAGLIEKLFDRFDRHLGAKGYIARGGQIVDATIVSVPKQRNSREENEAIKSGKTPAGWEKQPAKNAQKDKDARWTKKHGHSYYGYKNHVGIDAKHKFVRRFAATDASVHDSQKLDDVLDRSNTASGVWADSAYRSAEIEARLKAGGYTSRIHRRAHRNCPLSERETAANTTRSRIRARVEHVFGHQENSMGRKLVRTIGIVRATMKIGMMNLVYNMRRLVQLDRIAAAPA
jgi:IS5 family transposase